MTAEYFIQSIETLLPQLDRPTVVVLDNAKVHTARAVQTKRREWKKKGLRLLFLPPYSPHLNIIENLWRMIKYRWLTSHAYREFAELCTAVIEILGGIGTKYRISFV